MEDGKEWIDVNHKQGNEKTLGWTLITKETQYILKLNLNIDSSKIIRQKALKDHRKILLGQNCT